MLEEHGLLDHPHTSAGRVPTDAGYRYFVDRLLPSAPAARGPRPSSLTLVRREVDEAMRVTTETLSQLTDLLAIVTAPPLETATIRHVEVLLLQPQVLMVVVITSTGGVTKRVFTFERPSTPASPTGPRPTSTSELVGLGARRADAASSRISTPTSAATERRFLEALAPAFTELEETAASDALRRRRRAAVRRAAGSHDVTQLNDADGAARAPGDAARRAPRRARPRATSTCASARRTTLPALRGLAVVAAGLRPARSRTLGTVSVIGPVRMDYGRAIGSVRAAAGELSRFVEDVYDER